MKGKKAKPPFFSARRLSESLCLPRSCRCLHVGLDWWIYMFSILVEDTGEQGKHKSDHLAPQRSSRAFENTKSPLMLERDSSGHHCCTHEVLQSTLRTFLFCFFFSRKRGWGYVTNAEKKKKEPATYNHKAPWYNSLDTQSICSWLPVLCTGPPMNTGLFTWYHFVLWRLCNTQP